MSAGAAGASVSAPVTVPVFVIVTEPLASSPGRIAAARKIAAPSLEFDRLSAPGRARELQLRRALAGQRERKPERRQAEQGVA